MKHKIALVRGKFLNKYEMQFYEPLVGRFAITAFGSLRPYHDTFTFPVIKLLSPMDLPEFPYKMPLINRLLVDANYLVGLEDKLKNFDIVHSAETYFHYTQQSLNAKKKGYVKKVIATVLENIPFNNEGIWGRNKFKTRALRELDYIIALTKLTKAALIAEGADPDKITVISHYIDTNKFKPRIKNSNHFNKIIILFVGRLEEYKGVFDILKAASVLLHDSDLKRYKIIFRFVGAGSQEKRMKHFEIQHGIFSNIQHECASYEEMPKKYQEADIFVAPSKSTNTWMEQYNTALLEAQSSGLPIITTRSGGIPENIGDAGILINPGDWKSLVSELKKLILNPETRFRFGLSARKRAIKVHSIEIGSQKIASVYDYLLI